MYLLFNSKGIDVSIGDIPSVEPIRVLPTCTCHKQHHQQEERPQSHGVAHFLKPLPNSNPR